MHSVAWSCKGKTLLHDSRDGPTNQASIYPQGGAYRVVKVKAHELGDTGGGQLSKVGQGAHGCSVELVDAQVVKVLIAQGGLASQHLAQHHYLHGQQGTMRLGSTSKALAKRAAKYYRILQCRASVGGPAWATAHPDPKHCGSRATFQGKKVTSMQSMPWSLNQIGHDMLPGAAMHDGLG